MNLKIWVLTQFKSCVEEHIIYDLKYVLLKMMQTLGYNFLQ